MIIEYKKSLFGEGYDLCISGDAYKKANTEAGWNDHEAMLFAVRAYCAFCGCEGIRERITARNLEMAAQHTKGKGTIMITSRQDCDSRWIELYAITDSGIIPVKTRDKDGNIVINSVPKSRQPRNKRGGNSE